MKRSKLRLLSLPAARRLLSLPAARRLLSLLVGCAAALPLPAQKLAAGVDALWLATGMANIGAEMTVGRASTLSLYFMGISHPWVNTDMKGIALQPEWRYYLSGRPMYHHFIGIGAITGTYNFKFNNKLYNGSAAGLGLTFGYVLPISARLNIDLHAGYGLIHAQDRERGKHNYMLPTRMGVTVSYIFR